MEIQNTNVVRVIVPWYKASIETESTLFAFTSIFRLSVHLVLLSGGMGIKDLVPICGLEQITNV